MTNTIPTKYWDGLMNLVLKQATTLSISTHIGNGKLKSTTPYITSLNSIAKVNK
jgi:hypothetical protein